MYKLRFTRGAAKFYQKADSTWVKRLNNCISELAENPYHGNNIKQLHGNMAESFRLRAGDMRIIYSVDEPTKTVNIEIIGFRGDVYKK